MDSNQKGALAEVEIAAAATRLGVPVLRPIVEHGRVDLGFDLGGRLFRVQCKWALYDAEAGVIKINLQCSSLTASGYVRSAYAEHEIDLVAVYCGELDRCYLLPVTLVAGRGPSGCGCHRLEMASVLRLTLPPTTTSLGL